MKINPHKCWWIPVPFAVACRTCGAEASFDLAFSFHDGPDAASKACRLAKVTVPFSRGVVAVKYPGLFPWSDPANYWIGFNRPVAGVVSCPSCTARYKHVPEWPEDAYFKVDTPAGTLWAWDRRHLVAARDFIASADRDPSAHEGRFSYFLRHLPAEFLKAKEREAVVKAVDRFLEGRQ